MDQTKRVIIEGEKVHNVGYRPFLLWKVRELGIPNHDARNVKENGMERVVVSVGGEGKSVQVFVEFVKENCPEKAKVSRVLEAEPPERVMPVDEYQKVLDSEQHNTLIQAGLMMIDMQKQAVESINKGFSETKHDFITLRDDYGKISHTMEKILESMDNTSKKTEQVLERLTQQQESFTQAINGLTGAILKLAEKSAE